MFCLLISFVFTHFFGCGVENMCGISYSVFFLLWLFFCLIYLSVLFLKNSKMCISFFCEPCCKCTCGHTHMYIQTCTCMYTYFHVLLYNVYSDTQYMCTYSYTCTHTYSCTYHYELTYAILYKERKRKSHNKFHVTLIERRFLWHRKKVNILLNNYENYVFSHQFGFPCK